MHQNKLFLPRSKVITHRGLEPGNSQAYPESSFEAFQDHLNRGFGIEFDPNFAKDGIVVAHDASLKRITNGRDERQFSDVTVDELTSLTYGETGGRIPTFDEVLDLISRSASSINALHFKGKYQTEKNIHSLLEHLDNHPSAMKKILVFDVTPETARIIHGLSPGLQLAPSVAHPFDIERYNKVVGNTLFSLEDAVRYKSLFDWVWLDEWDTLGGNGQKKFYTRETFDSLRNAGYKILLVTPELHSSSPGLYGGESHSDAQPKEKLFARIQEIISLKPDAICTDYPNEAAGTA